MNKEEKKALADQISVLERAKKSIEAELKQVNDQLNGLKDEFQRDMEETKEYVYEDEGIRVKYVEPTERETVDVKRLKEEHPELASDYIKVSKTKASLRITVKKED